MVIARFIDLILYKYNKIQNLSKKIKLIVNYIVIITLLTPSVL